jgi:hypothetical protein
MDTSTRALRYDIFKLVVAILLLILFILLLRRPSLIPLTAAPATKTSTGTVPALPSLTLEANPVAVQATSTPAPRLTPATEFMPTDSHPSPTKTGTDAPAATYTPSPSETNLTTPGALQTSTQTVTPVGASTPTQIDGTPATTACKAAASRSRLQMGMSATILRRLNFRSSPGIRDNWLRTNIPGTIVEVIGGPECLPYIAGAYVWWQIRLPDGEIGWSAEGSIHGTFYFMEPG